MDDIELLKLENRGLRLQNEALQDEIKILRRYRSLIERSTQIAKALEGLPTLTVEQMTKYLSVTPAGT